MIVKNEEENLAACLESVEDFASELIIVDTGSRDRTVEIAQSFGARVKHFSWIDDFAAARNESIKDATGDWIFWMDADDRLSPENLVRLKQALVSGQADVYMCRVISEGMQHGSAEAVVEHLRLFPNHLGIHFEMPLHETIMGAARRKGLVTARTNIDIEHTGYKIRVEDFRAKARRNLIIIERGLEREPDNLYWRYHRGTVASILDDPEQAIADFEAVIADPPDSLHWDIYVYQAHANLVSLYNNAGRVDGARRVLDLMFERFPHRRHLAIFGAIFHLMQDELAEALSLLRRAQELPAASDLLGQIWPPGKLEWVLGQVYLLQGDIPQAGTTYRAMLVEIGQEEKSEPLPQVAQAEAMFETGDYEAIFDLLDPVAPGNPAALRLLARSEDRRERWRYAAACLSQAIALSGAGPGEWVKLAELVLRGRQFDSAARLCRLTLAEESENVDALNLLGFIAIQRQDIEQAMVYLIKARLADDRHTWVQENLEQVAEALGLSLTAALREHGQRMISQRKYACGAEAFTLLLELAPTDVEAYKSLAVALQGLGQAEDALVVWQTAQQLVVQPHMS